jgi:hypothetical protein
MHRVTKLAAVVAIVGVLTASGAVAIGKSGGSEHRGSSASKSFRATLTGYEEVPALSTAASGSFRASLNRAGTQLSWTLTYRNFATPVQLAHVHFGQKGVNGGVSAFFCSNLPGAPPGTQACPARSARLSGTVRAQDVVGPAGQGIGPGELSELVSAMRAGVTYVNVHSDAFPNGEIRGQVGPPGRVRSHVH